MANIANNQVAINNLRLLRQQRISRGWSRSDLASMMGVSDTLIANAENHPEKCSLVHYKALSRIFNWTDQTPPLSINNSTGQQQQFVFPDDMTEEPLISLPEDTSRRLNFCVDKAFHTKLKILAAKRGCSISDIMRKALVSYMNILEANNDH